MCITLEPDTRLADTTIYSAKVLRNGEQVHALMYHNAVEHSAARPNAMLLPIPSREVLDSENFVDSRSLGWLPGAYRTAVRSMKPRLRGRSDTLTKGLDPDARYDRSVKVFQSGSYTIVSSLSVDLLRDTVKGLPTEIRPEIPDSFIQTLGTLYRGWSFVACCFDGRSITQGRSMDPIILWYRPLAERQDLLFAPAIDAHDGRPPNPSARVPRDHCLAFGAHDGPLRNLPALNVLEGLPESCRWMFTRSIVGSEVVERDTLNGDFVMPVSRVLNQPGYVGADEIKVMVP